MSNAAYPHQHTLAGPAVFAGVGLHTGQRVRAAILPAPADSGIVFLRTDVQGDGRIEARAGNVSSTRLSTVIRNASGATVSTVELDQDVVDAEAIEGGHQVLDGGDRDALGVPDHRGEPGVGDVVGPGRDPAVALYVRAKEYDARVGRRRQDRRTHAPPGVQAHAREHGGSGEGVLLGIGEALAQDGLVQAWPLL